ncbi:hypothetical protein ACFS5L_34575 [Streptomyces phyllanthi]|uniref:hypothetical protein n=1 Tax=Streptomyces phyllanthi TaxID=1803180 RepID=UPI001883F30E|nr:hypothetical protein [Streptomyces phyllanthi]
MLRGRRAGEAAAVRDRAAGRAVGVTLLPGRCNGIEGRGDWLEVLDGDGWASFGHDPSPLAERRGDTVRLTVDADRDGSPGIELPADELRRLLAGAERDLTGFLRPAATWAARHGRICRAVPPRSRPLSPVPWRCPRRWGDIDVFQPYTRPATSDSRHDQNDQYEQYDF